MSIKSSFWALENTGCSWWWRCKEHPCHLSSHLGLWRMLAVSDWGFASWSWFGYSQEPCLDHPWSFDHTHISGSSDTVSIEPSVESQYILSRCWCWCPCWCLCWCPAQFYLIQALGLGLSFDNLSKSVGKYLLILLIPWYLKLSKTWWSYRIFCILTIYSVWNAYF